MRAFTLVVKKYGSRLKPRIFSVAEARLAAARKEIREQRARTVDTANAKITFGDAAKLHLQHVDADSSSNAGHELTGTKWMSRSEKLGLSWLQRKCGG